MWVLWTVVSFVLVNVFGRLSDQTPVIGSKGTKCYDNYNRPQRCIPEFENAAFNVLMEATNTCGDFGPEEYCQQTGVTGVRRSCDICYPNQHHARFLTDIHNQDNPSWWQSETIMEGIQWPYQVNLTLKFGKTFDITYVRIWFWSPRPESFFISKRTTEGGPWIPYQYYSATCRDTYGLPDWTHTSRGEETRALCTSEYSDISPLKGGNVAFSTLEGRPSAYNFDGSPELQEWVTATEIMITLDRLNTFGDEVFGDSQVLKSYFYAIADISVGARCKCNGHASECVTLNGPNGYKRRVCRCEHNTAGPDCNECLPFYNDVPWARATANNPHECKECNCNGFSNRCFFDQKLYDESGHGGHCLDCSANRDGPTCERCRQNYYMREDGYCIPCECNEMGSKNLQCDDNGNCQCQPGVIGEKCDRCDIGFYDFSSNGCKSCGCSEDGSATKNCDQRTGHCFCKEHVEGKHCRECKPGFFNLEATNPFGCTPCFCFGHISECSSAPGYSKYTIESRFSGNPERWMAEDNYEQEVELKYENTEQSIGVKAIRNEVVYFSAPAIFLGNQRASYNQLFEFTLRIGDNRAEPSPADVILEGSSMVVSLTIFAQENRIPNIQDRKYIFRLHEHPEYGWQPRLSSKTFISILSNLTAIKIRGTYYPEGIGFLDNVRLHSAIRGRTNDSAMWIETCECPAGYVGQFCESCAPGFRHFPPSGGSFAPCIPCECNNHASICDSETGKCICQHNTAGENCQLCARGYYGNAFGGTPEDCQPCNCPNGGPCIQIDETVVMCTECPQGYTDHKCDSCSDGYFGDPTGKFGPPTSCTPCNCNQNIDLNAIENCNTTTGECLKCIFNTAGTSCDLCMPGFYGNALVLPKGDCKPCQCYPPGTMEDKTGAPMCDQTTGACQCKPYVVGRNCEQCENGYYNIYRGSGCQVCNCDPVGSLNQTCDVHTGQCHCRPGVTGLRCDHCELRKYGFSYDGCKDCDCDPLGSSDLQCDVTGQCSCVENVEGRKCDRCKENKYDRQRGCIDCPQCYTLVQESARSANNKLDGLKKILDDIESHPVVVNDEDFPQELKRTQFDIRNLNKDVRAMVGNNGLIDHVREIDKTTKEVSRALSKIDEDIFLLDESLAISERNIDQIDELTEEANEKLDEIKDSFEYNGKRALNEAVQRAKIVGEHSDKMTKLAHEARDITHDIDSKVIDIITKAENTKNKSIDGYTQVKEAIFQQAQLVETLRYFKEDLVSVEKKVNDTIDWTKEVSNRASQVKSNATALLSEVNNLLIPKVDMYDLKEKSNNLKEEAVRLSHNSDQLLKDTFSMRKNIDEQTEEGRKILQDARNQQTDIIELKNDLVFAGAQANAATKLWNEIYDGAVSNYKLLTEFDTQTKKSKEEADAALKTVDEIDASIKEAMDGISRAQKEVDEATKSADLAFQKAQEAKTLANDVLTGTKEARMEADLLYKNTSGLRIETGLMYDRVQNTDGELKNLVEKHRSNESLVNEAKEKVGRAGKETDEVSQKVQKLLQEVEKIMTDMKNSPTLDESDIDKLEEQIRITEEQLQETKLEESLETLQKEYKERSELTEQYKLEIAWLQSEVDNIEDIIKTLPKGCFRRLELEP